MRKVTYRGIAAAAMVGTSFLACHSSHPEGAPAPAAASAPAASAAPSRPLEVTTAAIEAGGVIFNGQSCVRCHGAGGVGGPRGPNLTDDKWIHIDGSYPAIVALVTTGFTKAEQHDPSFPFAMNPRGGTQLTDEQIKNVAAYVWALSRK
jgi:mono/diheme cytochrome c family protein